MVKKLTKAAGFLVLSATAATAVAGGLSPQIYKSDGSPVAPKVRSAALNYANFWNTGKAKFAKEALAPDFTDMTPPEGRVAGIKGVLAASKNFRKAVPDLHVVVEHLLITGKFATIRYRFKGTFTGVMDGTKGKGQTVDFPAVDIYEVKSGKIQKNWHLEDYNTFFGQIK